MKAILAPPQSSSLSSSSSSLFQSEVAVKVLLPKSGINSDSDYELLKISVDNEVKMLREIESKLPLQSEHVIKILGVVEGDLPPSFELEFGKKKALGIVMRLEAGGTLANFLRVSRGLRIIDKLHIALQLARGLAELHEIGVIHGDVKPENILLSHHNPPFLRLGDFGQSSFSSSSKSSLGVSTLKSTFTKQGTPLYFAPELLLVDVQTGARAKASRRSDVYAMSLVLHELFCAVHQPPYHNIVDEQQLVEQVVKMDRRPPISAISSDAPVAISRMIELGWHKDRSIRLSANECYVRLDQCYNVMSSSTFDIFLSHPWSKKNVMIHIKRFFASIGYKTFYDQDDMQWDLKKTMEEGILRSSVVLACISRDYESSRNCMFELSEARKLACSKPIVTLSTDANPFSWAGSDIRFGDLKQLCDISGQGKMFFDIGDICSNPAWNETDDSLIPRQLIDELHLKLSELVKFLRGSQINCVPSLSSSNDAIDAIFERKMKADIEAWNKRRKDIALHTITTADEAYRYLLQFEENLDLSALGGEVVIASQLASINALQERAKTFNEELVLLGTCEQLAKIFRLLPLPEVILAKLLILINYLCRYDGETKATSMDSHLVLLGKCGMIELIVSVLENQLKSALVAEHACIVISSISDNSDNRKKLESSGCCELLVGVMIHHQDSSAVCENTCGAIRKVAVDDDIKAKFGFLGCCELLVRVMTQHQDSCALCEQACWAIRNIAVSNTDNQVKFGSSGCCELLIRVMTQHQNSREVCENACGAIRNIASYDNIDDQAKFGSSGCCELLVRVMTQHQDSREVCEQACWAIRNLACNADNQMKFGLSGCCELLVKVLVHRIRTRAICKQVCAAIWNLCNGNSSNVLKFKSCNCVALLNSALTHYKDDPELVKYTNGALVSLQ